MNKLEKLVKLASIALYNTQVAWLFKVPEEMGQTPCDFFGHTSKGRAILLECKNVDRAALPIGTSNGLAPHQVRALTQAERGRAISLLAWMRRDQVAIVTTKHWLALSEGRESVPWQDGMELWAVKADVPSIVKRMLALVGDD